MFDPNEGLLSLKQNVININFQNLFLEFILKGGRDPYLELSLMLKYHEIHDKNFIDGKFVSFYFKYSKNTSEENLRCQQIFSEWLQINLQITWIISHSKSSFLTFFERVIRLRKKKRNSKSQQIQYNVELKSKHKVSKFWQWKKKPELEFLHKIKTFEKNK